MTERQPTGKEENDGELFRLLAENVKDYAIFVVDPQGRVQNWNPGAERLLGYREEEVIGQSAEVFFTPEDVQSGVVQREMQQSLEEGRGNDDRWHVRKDGSRFWAGGMMTPLWDEGRKLRGFAKIMRDRTEWKLAEQAREGSEARQLTILATALDAIITIDHEGRVVEFNPAAEKMFGYVWADAQGRDIAELIVPSELRPAHYRGMAHFLSTGEGPVLDKRIEMPAQRADGTRLTVELAITRVPTDGPPLFTAFLRDISEKTRIERYRNTRLAITQVLAQAATLPEAATALLKTVCESLGWDVGFFWALDPGDDALHCVESWHKPGLAITEFETTSRQRRFGRGEGLPGHTWAAGKPAWLLDAARATNFPRAVSAAEEGLHAAFACPLVVRRETLGVIEFFSQRIQEPDPDLLETMATVAGLIGQFVERMRSEEALRQSEARFRGLMEQAPFSVQVFSPDGRTIRVNRAWEELWGTRFDQIASYNILADRQLEARGVLHYIHKGFTGQTARLPAIQYNPNETLPDVTQHSDPRRWLSAVIYPLKDTEGLVREVVLIHEDITARKLAEDALLAAHRELEAKVAERTAELARTNEFLQALLQNVQDGIVACNAEGVLTLFNQATREFHGLPVEPIPADRWAEHYDLYRADDQSRMSKDEIPLFRALRGERVQNAEMIITPKGSPPRIVLASGQAFYDGRGEKLGAVVSMHDITERKLAEERLRQAHEELERRVEQRTQELGRANAALRDADRRKDEFLATLAHELRNPLAPIRNSLQILKMPRVDAATARQTTDMMERQVHHLVRLVDDLLDVSRVMRGKIELRKEHVELATVVARAVETAQPLIEVQGHQLDISLPPESLLLDADPVRLAQVVGNLLTNAAKYTEANGRIWLTAQRENDQAVLKVRDNGIGISCEMLAHVFELFVQVDYAATRAQGGLGIGLTLVKNLVEMHAGTVEAKSAGLGHGCEFVIRLPLVVREPPGPPAQQSGHQQSAISPSGHRLLVVDDNQDAAISLAMLLRLQGHEVRVAHDGPAALEVATSYRPNMVFLDLGMPGMDGYEVARRLRGSPGLEKTVLAALTGWGQQEDRRRTAAAGFDHHLVKPLEPKALESLLAELKRRAAP
ncbi:MAG: PAS domain S-box protein [Pirellulaceae bacterium]